MTDIEILIAHMQRVQAYLAAAEKSLNAEIGTDAAKISAAAIAIGAAHSSFSDLTGHLSKCGGSIEAIVARIDGMKCVAEGPCSCGEVHSAGPTVCESVAEEICEPN